MARTETHTGATRVVASFEDMGSARKAITALELAGVDGGNIALLGQAREQMETEPDTKERDAGVAKLLTVASMVGGTIGFVVGAIAGLVGGALFFGWDGQGLLTMAVGMGFVGAPIGGLVAAHGLLGESPTWEQTFQESVKAGRVVVGVHATSEQEVEQAVGVLKKAGPLKVERLDNRKRRVAAV